MPPGPVATTGAISDGAITPTGVDVHSFPSHQAKRPAKGYVKTTRPSSVATRRWPGAYPLASSGTSIFVVGDGERARILGRGDRADLGHARGVDDRDAALGELANSRCPT